jgi:arsenate reductase
MNLQKKPSTHSAELRSFNPALTQTWCASRRLLTMTKKARVLFLCTHNSARSQMAEGLLKHLAGDRFEAMSAGTEATHVRPLAVRAMEEVGVDISGQESKTLDRYLNEPFDHVITVCDDANEACPFFPGAASRLHWSFEDPSNAEGSEEERLAVYRLVRDRIRERIEADLVAMDEVVRTSYKGR